MRKGESGKTDLETTDRLKVFNATAAECLFLWARFIIIGWAPSWLLAMES